ncbi:DUF4760 domain-containing protein [Alteromonas stellipolaris]|uniref:DUF4760 domain-containing protein n=1 Tax=Alteromonas stellipolaris TaxID=233316 RepID=UPI00273300C5|nr:DUF4760 domain-containing protein [Alteromonas stellipolaris]MDP2596009.1 DUF4760 domain-containing protein [Alteromonas stellipolaris]
MGIFDLASFISQIIIVYVLFTAFYFYYKNQREKRRTASLDYIRRWNDLGYQRILSSISDDALSQHKDIRDVLQYSAMGMKYRDDKEADFMRVWDFFEELSIAIIFNQIDEEIAKEFFFYSLIQTYRISEKSFLKLRMRQKNKALYANFERVFGKWTASKEYTLVREVVK